MTLHLGGNVVIPIKNIISIIGIENIENSQINKEFFDIAKDEDFIRKVSDDEPKSLILTEFDKKTIIFMSPISSMTLLKRSSFIETISLGEV